MPLGEVASPAGITPPADAPARRGGFWPGALLSLVLTIPALWPLARAGFFISDDGRFHVYRIAALSQAWAQGLLYPRLFPDFGFGYGQAVLNYYAPLSYWPGALLAMLGVGPAWAAKLTIALGFLLAALAAYGYCRSLWGVAGGVLGAVAYTYFPYHLADAYVRGAIPEHFAFIWPPLILWSCAVAFRSPKPRPALLWGALAWAGLIYTHNLTAVLMAPVAVLYLVVMAWWTRRWRRLLPAAGSFVLALALSAPLWLPFLAENRYVGIALGPSDGYRLHLAPLARFVLGTPFYTYRVGQGGGTADHPLSWTTPALFLLIAGLALVRFARGRSRSTPRRRGQTVAWPALAVSLLLTAVSAFMVTAISLPVWLPLQPILGHLQYPWRFLPLTCLGVAGLAAALPSLLGRAAPRGSLGDDGHEGLSYDGRPSSPGETAGSAGLFGGGRASIAGAVAAAVGLVLLVQPLPGVPAQPLPMPDAQALAPDRMWREDAEAGQVGATWTGEFLPLTVREQRWALGRPKEDAQDGPGLAARPQVRLSRLAYDRLEAEVLTSGPATLVLHQFHLPAWRAWLDGRPAPAYPMGDLGLVAVDVPAGSHRLALQFGPTPAWIVSTLLALAGVVVWAVLAWNAEPRGNNRTESQLLRPAAILLVVLALVLALNGAGLGRRYVVPLPHDTALGDVAVLIGHTATPAQGENALDVTLYWLALREVSGNYKAFVHLLGPQGEGQVIAQHDGDPGGGFTPTSRWAAGEIIPDRHRIPLPDGLVPGAYRLKAGLYELGPEGPRNLSLDPPSPDGRLDLGSVEISR